MLLIQVHAVAFPDAISALLVLSDVTSSTSPSLQIDDGHCVMQTLSQRLRELQNLLLQGRADSQIVASKRSHAEPAVLNLSTILPPPLLAFRTEAGRYLECNTE
ncbi:hypothetical protein DL768_010704 [Monosporascus sp. mg162]|nr:hypothetical protein DL768_010704 [Monosporascus sp. mg162]